MEKLMSINGWTYLVIKILIFMKCAYVFAEQCSSKLKETSQIYGRAAGSERDCGPAGVRGGAGGRRLGGPPAAQLPRLVPRPPLPPHLLRRHLPATSTLSTSATRRRTSTGGTRTIRTWPVPSNKCTKMRPHRQPRGRPGCRRQQRRRQQRRRRGAQPAALAHRPPRHDPQQPLHAQVSKYSVQSIFIIIHLNLCRLGSNLHLEASLKSVCGMNFCNLLQHQPKTRRLWTLWTIFIVDFMTIFMYI